MSLVYMGIGPRENTAAVRSAALQAVTSTSQASLLAQASDAGLSHVRAEGWGTYQRIMCQQFTKPGVRETWRLHADVLDPTLVETAEVCSTVAGGSAP